MEGWVPPKYGDAVVCVCADGTLSLWEEVVEGILELLSYLEQCSSISRFLLEVYRILTPFFNGK